MRAKTYVSMTVPHYSMWLASGGVPNVLDFEASLLFLESRVNVTGPYVPGQQNQ
jgi:hypothetical protein